MPYYSEYCEIIKEDAEIYNKNGEKLDLFFIRDKHAAHCPYYEISKYFFFDRFNIGLNTHFYTHTSILETMGKPIHRYGYFFESESIVPEEYQIFDTHPGIEKDFDAIFTYSEKLLNKLNNAKFFPGVANIWYSKEYANGIKDNAIPSPNQHKTKSDLFGKNLYQTSKSSPYDSKTSTRNTKSRYIWFIFRKTS